MHFIVFIFITLIDILCNAGANKVVVVVVVVHVHRLNDFGFNLDS